MGKAKRAEREQFRDAIFARDGYRCLVCRGPQYGLDAHHITPRKECKAAGLPEYDVDNGITLCGDCHVLAEEHIDDNDPKWGRGALRALLPKPRG